MNGQCPYCHSQPDPDGKFSYAVRRRWDPDLDSNACDGTSKRQRDTNGVRAQLKRELVHFCRNTTIRGIPRIVKARSSRLRWLWLFSVFLLFAGCFGCMVFLTKQYLEYNVIHPPRVLRDGEAPFPALTVCNLRPLSRNGKVFLAQNHLKDPRAYGRSVNRYGQFQFFKRNNRTFYYKLTAFISLGGYLESLPGFIRDKNYELLGHDLKHMVLHCSVLYLANSSSTRLTKRCNDVGEWSHIVHATFLNCYTYNLKKSFRNNTKSIELFLYLNEDLNATTCVDCFTQDAKTQQSGAAIHIHNAETYPNLNQELINLMPGTLTEIKLKSYENIQKEPPHGRCSPHTPAHIYLAKDKYVYSEYACRLATIQKAINERCHCSAIEFPMENLSLPYCSELPYFIYANQCIVTTQRNGSQDPMNSRCHDNVEVALHRQVCKMSVTKNFEKDVVSTCSLHCSFFSYDSDRSTSIWPSKAFQTTWLQTRIGRLIVNNPEMYPYRLAMEYMRKGNHSYAWKILQSTNVVEKNLVGVFVNRPNFNVHKVEEKEVLSLTSFLSMAGGLLSIFIGLTFISAVEIGEFIVNCFFAVRGRTKNNNSGSGNRAETEHGSKPLAGGTYIEGTPSPRYDAGQPGFRSFACSHRTDTHILECRHCSTGHGNEASL